MFGYSNQSFVKKRKSKKKLIIIVSVITIMAMLTSGVAGYMYYKNVYSKPYGKYDLNDYIKVAKYKGLTIDNKEIKISKKQVRKAVDKNIEATSTTKTIKKGKVNNGDTINISYTGTIDNKKFKNSSAKNTTVTIGSGAFVNGFESGLIGAEIGKETTLDITFPEDYTEQDLAGKEAVFKVTVNNKEETNVPEYNKKWIKENTSYTTKKEYEESIKNELYEEAKAENKKQTKEKLWKEVVSNSKAKKYPEEEVKRIKKSIVRQYKIYAKQYKMKYKDFLLEQLDVGSMEKFEKELTDYAKDSVKQEEITYYIANKEKISVSKKEYKAFKKKTLKDYGYETEKEFKESIGKSYDEYAGKMNIYSEIYKEKVKRFIYSNANIS